MIEDEDGFARKWIGARNENDHEKKNPGMVKEILGFLRILFFSGAFWGASGPNFLYYGILFVREFHEKPW